MDEIEIRASKVRDCCLTFSKINRLVASGSLKSQPVTKTVAYKTYVMRVFNRGYIRVFNRGYIHFYECEISIMYIIIAKYTYIFLYLGLSSS